MTKQNQQHSAWSNSPATEYYRDSNDYDIGGQEYTDHHNQESGDLFDESSNSASFGQFSTEPDTSADYYDDNYTSDNYAESGFYESSHYGEPANTDQFQTDGIQVYYDDLDDVRHPVHASHLSKTIFMAASTLMFLGFVAAMISTSQPDMSAREIVQQESYKGSQKAQSVFNLADLHGCTSVSDCLKESRAASRAEIAKITEQAISVREIQAISRAQNETIPLQSTSIDSDAGTSLINNIERRIRIVDTQPLQPQVQKQWSIIRTIPDMTGGIITSLAKGTPVEIVGTSGEWYEIIAINRAAPRGFMHKSTIANDL